MKFFLKYIIPYTILLLVIIRIVNFLKGFSTSENKELTEYEKSLIEQGINEKHIKIWRNKAHELTVYFRTEFEPIDPSSWWFKNTKQALITIKTLTNDLEYDITHNIYGFMTYKSFLGITTQNKRSLYADMMQYFSNEQKKEIPAHITDNKTDDIPFSKYKQ